jgi:hypothetical protein
MGSKGPMESSPLSPSLCELASRSETTKHDEYILYPNPAGNNIEVNLPGIMRIQIYSNTGALMLEIENSNSLNISELTGGLYWAKVKTKDGIFYTNFVKN